MPTYKINVQSLSALGMSRTDIEAMRYSLDKALTVNSTDDLPEGAVNQYFTIPRARQSISVAGNLSYNATSGVITYNTPTTFPWLGITGTPTTLVGYGITDAEPTIAAGTTAQYWRGDKSWQTLNKAAVGLGNVDNTSDANKPVSTAQQTALDLKANISNIVIVTKEGVSGAMVAGSVTVADASITATSRVLYSRKTAGGTLGHISQTQTAGVGFTLTSTSATETSTFVYQIFDPQ
jgi:hypothetical protein